MDFGMYPNTLLLDVFSLSLRDYINIYVYIKYI